MPTIRLTIRGRNTRWLIADLESWLKRYGVEVLEHHELPEPDPNEERGPALPLEEHDG